MRSALKVATILALVAGLVLANQLVGSTATNVKTNPPSAAPNREAAVEQPVVAAEAPVAPEAAPARDRPLLVGRGPGSRPPRGERLQEGGPNFVSVCRYNHSNQDDPIVYPGVRNVTHHHDFFANVTTNANSTYESLRAGDSTCRIAGDTAAYWVPSLWAGGKLVEPTLARIYYLPGQKDHRTVRPFPAGLKVLAKGDNVRVRWSCVGDGQARTKAQESPPACPGAHLVEHIRFPDCWDGEHLDTADHTSNMTFARDGGCPSSHPVPVPAIVLNIHYPTSGGDVALGFPDKPVAAHADFFNAWDQVTLERLVRMCINAGVHCGANPPGARSGI